MDPTVVAAVIAAVVSVLTLVGTLAAQYFGRRATSRDTQQALDRTLGEQRKRTLNERFATAAEQLGSDKPAVRLAGVYAMAGLADDWGDNRQTCVDVLCAYLRMPYEFAPGEEASTSEKLTFRSNREVRHTVIRVIAAHLKEDAAASWQGLNFDFTGVVFDGGVFAGVRVSSGTVRFNNARFPSGAVSFYGAEFSGGIVDFNSARFSGGTVVFQGADFSGGTVSFYRAEFSAGKASFTGARFFDGKTNFAAAKFSGGQVDFSRARFPGGEVSFEGAQFSDGRVDFSLALFSGSKFDFDAARFTGAEVDYEGAEFSGGTVDFRYVGDWSTRPAFPWTDTPPPSVKLPSSGPA